jgi:WD40 repeat protein
LHVLNGLWLEQSRRSLHYRVRLSRRKGESLMAWQPKRQMAYRDFDVLLERAGRTYRARVLNAPAGQTPAVGFTVPVSPLELENFLLKIGRPRRVVRRVDAPETAAAKAFGGKLYRALFQAELEVNLLRSQDLAAHDGAGLRIRLRLSDVPELADLPWEFLYDSARNRFLCLSERMPLVRYLEVRDPPRPVHVSPPLQVLVMISSPNDYVQLDVEHEWARLHDALAPLQRAGHVRLERLEAATLEALRQRLRRDDWHVFHFVGHGGFDQRTQDGVLMLEDRSGRGRPVSGQDLGVLLNDYDPLRLVVLNACEGARADPTDPFAGTAQTLIQQGIPAVVAMQFEITDLAAIVFAHELYAVVADGYPLDAALTQARKAIFTDVSQVEWATPVLYLRAPDGRVFEVPRVHAAREHSDKRSHTYKPQSTVHMPPSMVERPVAGETKSPTRHLARFDTGGETVAVALSPDGRLVAAVTKVARPAMSSFALDRPPPVAVADVTTRIWDIGTGEQIAQLPRGIFTGNLKFSPDGGRLAFHPRGLGSVEVWDIARRERVVALNVADIRARMLDRALAFSPDGAHVATSGQGGAEIWNVLDGRKVGKALFEVADFDYREAAVVAFSPDGNSLAMAYSGFVRVYDLPTKSDDVDFYIDKPVTVLAYGPGGDRLAAAGENRAKVWNLDTKHTEAECTTEEGPIADIAFGQDGRQMVTVTAKPSRGVIAQAWDLDIDVQDRRAAFSKRIDLLSGRGGRTVLSQRFRTRTAVLNGDGRRLALVDNDDILHVWQIG